MSILLDPLDEDQMKLLKVIWDPFSREGARFPVFGYVDYQMRQMGLDAAAVMNGLPTIGQEAYRSGGYRAAWCATAGGLAQKGDIVHLTMAGLYQIPHESGPVINALLAFLRQMTHAQKDIADNPYSVPEVSTGLARALQNEGIDEQALPWASAVSEYEWPGMNATHNTTVNGIVGRLGLLAEANFYTIDDYLVAITAATTPQRPKTMEYRDPRALVRTIGDFDRTWELVLGTPVVKKPAMDRSALLVQPAQNYSDLQSGMSALGEVIGELQVPGRTPSHPTGRLLGHLVSRLPKLDQAGQDRVKSALDQLDAVREIRNSGQHPKPSPKLISAHELLGLPFPIREPSTAWDTIRAEIDVAFGTLQEEIYAAR